MHSGLQTTLVHLAADDSGSPLSTIPILSPGVTVTERNTLIDHRATPTPAPSTQTAFLAAAPSTVTHYLLRKGTNANLFEPHRPKREANQRAKRAKQTLAAEGDAPAA